MGNHVVIIHSNALALNVRVLKEIKANNHKYEFTFLGWNRNPKLMSDIQMPSNSNLELFNFKAPYGVFSILYMPFWWIYVFIWLMRKDWDIVHVINLDSSLSAFLAAKIKRKKAIYELLETYEDNIALPITIRNLIIAVDKFLISRFDGIILVDEEQVEELEGIPNDNQMVIYDSPPDILKDSDFRKKENQVFTLFYAGAFHKMRKLNLDKLVNVLSEIDDIKLIIAGYGDKDMIDEILEYERKMPEKISFIGKIEYEEVIKLAYQADLLFQLRDSNIISSKYICGSTLFNAMAAGTPMIVNKGTSTANKVLRANSGIIVDANNPLEIKNAIIKLKKNPSLCRKLGSNARKAYLNNYSWQLMGERLEKLYDGIA